MKHSTRRPITGSLHWLITSFSGIFQRFVIVLFFLPIPLFGQNLWDGSSDTSWNTPANWSTNVVPISGQATEIDVVTGNMPVLSGTTANTGALVVGNWRVNSTGTSTLTIQNSGTLSSNGTVSLGQEKSGFVTVTGSGSTLSVPTISVGSGAGSGSGVLNVYNGATVTASSALTIGVGAGRIGSVTVDRQGGSATTMNIAGTVTIGVAGNGSMTVANGATVVNTSGNRVTVGQNAGANGVLTVTGTGSSFSGGTNFEFEVGSNAFGGSGTGTVNLAEGGNLTWFSGNGNMTLANKAGSAGTLNIGTGALAGTLSAATVTGGLGTAAVVFNHTSGSFAFNPTMAGSLSVAHTGSGTTILSGPAANSYSGATTVSAGTLIVSGGGSINSTSGIGITGGKLKYDSSVGLNRAVTINGGGLAYNSSSNYSGALTFTSGTVGGTNLGGNLNNLTIGANQTISPGNSPGTAATGGQTWAGGGSYLWEINNATGTAGTAPGWDLLTGTGSLAITATSGTKFNINVTSLTLGNVAGDAVNFVNTTNYQWMVADFSSAITLDTTVFNINVAGFSNTVAGGSSFGLALGSSPGIGGDNTQLYLTYTAVPEPSTCLLLGVSLATLFLRRRRFSR